MDIVQGCEGRSKVTLAVLHGLVDAKSKRRRRRVGVYDRPAAHKSTPDWLKQKRSLLSFCEWLHHRKTRLRSPGEVMVLH